MNFSNAKASSKNIMYIHHSERNNKNWLHFRHTHPFGEIFYITSGKGKFIVNNEEVLVAEKELILISPQAEHTEFSDHADPMSYFVIGLEDISLLNHTGTAISHLVLKDKTNEFTFYFYKIYEELERNKKHADIITQNLIMILLLLIERKIEVKIQTQRNNNEDHSAFLIKHFIDMNYKQNITLDSLAKSHYMNKYYLSHRFKEAYSVPPMRYLKTLRINKIKELLSCSNYSITEISSLLGYSSPSYLTQVFKKETGLSPVDYRKKTGLANSSPKREL